MIISLFLILLLAGSFTPVISAPVILTYPQDASYTLNDDPLLFRWISTGDVRYRFSLDDDKGFYRVLLRTETANTYYQYPLTPRDRREALVPGRTYYWKVEGIDANGNVTSASAQIHSFRIENRGNSSAALSRDIAIDDIIITSLEPAGAFRVSVTNTGGRTETNVGITFYLNGISCGTRYCRTIQSGAEAYKDFLVKIPDDLQPNKPLIASASITISDDNIYNNILTRKLYLPEDYFTEQMARISGTILEQADDDTSAGIGMITISYTGIRSDHVYSDSNGNYTIGGLPAGEYTIKVKSDYHLVPPPRTLLVENGSSYDDINFSLIRTAPTPPVQEQEEPGAPKPVKEAPVKPAEPAPRKETFSIDDYWVFFTQFIPEDILIQLGLYKLQDIQNISNDELIEITDAMKQYTATIMNIKIKPAVSISKENVPEEKSALVTKVSGKPTLLRNKTLKWEQVKEGQFLAIDDKVRTDAKSYAALSFVDGFEMIMNNNTSLVISPPPTPADNITIELIAGELYVIADSQDTVYIEAETASVSFDKAEGNIKQHRELSVAAYDGSISIENKHGSVILAKNEQNLILSDSAPGSPARIDQPYTWQNSLRLPNEKSLEITVQTAQGRKKKIKFNFQRPAFIR